MALLKSHISGDDQQFLSTAMQVAAHEAQLGHTKLAEQLRELIDKARKKSSLTETKSGPILVLQPKSDLASLLSVSQPEIRLGSMSLPRSARNRLDRVILEYKQQARLRARAEAPP